MNMLISFFVSDCYSMGYEQKRTKASKGSD